MSFDSDTVSQTRGLTNRLENYVYDHAGRRYDRGMIGRMRMYVRFHSLGHEKLRFVSDHPILLGHQEPA